MKGAAAARRVAGCSPRIGIWHDMRARQPAFR
jgi:hypothetical protein